MVKEYEERLEIATGRYNDLPKNRSSYTHIVQEPVENISETTETTSQVIYIPLAETASWWVGRGADGGIARGLGNIKDLFINFFPEEMEMGLLRQKIIAMTGNSNIEVPAQRVLLFGGEQTLYQLNESGQYGTIQGTWHEGVPTAGQIRFFYRLTKTIKHVDVTYTTRTVFDSVSYNKALETARSAVELEKQRIIDFLSSKDTKQLTDILIEIHQRAVVSDSARFILEQIDRLGIDIKYLYKVALGSKNPTLFNLFLIKATEDDIKDILASEEVVSRAQIEIEEQAARQLFEQIVTEILIAERQKVMRDVTALTSVFADRKSDVLCDSHKSMTRSELCVIRRVLHENKAIRPDLIEKINALIESRLLEGSGDTCSTVNITRQIGLLNTILHSLQECVKCSYINAILRDLHGSLKTSYTWLAICMFVRSACSKVETLLKLDCSGENIHEVQEVLQTLQFITRPEAIQRSSDGAWVQRSPVVRQCITPLKKIQEVRRVEQEKTVDEALAEFERLNMR